jgi:hypothetical protein
MPLTEEFAAPSPQKATLKNLPLESHTQSGEVMNEPDREVRALLRQVLFEIRKQNRLLSAAFGVEVSDSDVEV